MSRPIPRALRGHGARALRAVGGCAGASKRRARRTKCDRARRGFKDRPAMGGARP